MKTARFNCHHEEEENRQHKNRVYSKRYMPGIDPGPLGWHTSVLTTELQQVSGLDLQVR